jgi:hypothetical protein
MFTSTIVNLFTDNYVLWIRNYLFKRKNLFVLTYTSVFKIRSIILNKTDKYKRWIISLLKLGNYKLLF